SPGQPGDSGAVQSFGRANGNIARARNLVVAGTVAAPGVGGTWARTYFLPDKATRPPRRKRARQPAGTRAGPHSPPRSLGALVGIDRVGCLLVVSAGMAGAATIARP